MNEAQPLDLAGRLAALAGEARPQSAELLAGGKNNRVWRVRLADGGDAILKQYYSDPRDPRDRLGAEWNFLTYAKAHGVANVPAPLACDRASHAGLYEFVAGRRLRPGEVDARAVAAASDFIVAINAPPREPLSLAPGSEACFSVTDHLATVGRRVARLAELDTSAPHAGEAAELVSANLAPMWEIVRARILTEAASVGIDVGNAIAPVCVSPSDFGFHNALAGNGGAITFIDFEYAGHDDPAKLVCDFFCQPEVPVAIDHFEPFLAALGAPLELAEADLWRCRALLAAYRIKWVCIILNEFLDVGASRRAFADTSDRAERAARQIERARRHLALVLP
ncbi:MAG: aminoglycoside phosphotransferase [Alphaproteobacteria bacterium]|nr:MAG: aminoglycoside phosphotransferase [Alphaproteobacteria bacterium]